jgi:hypothetical protein
MSDVTNPMKCPRCETDLNYVGTKSFHEGTRWGFLGELGELFVNKGTGAEILSFLAYGSGYSRGVYVAGSDLVVPEPTSVTLLLLAALGLAIGRSAKGRS